MQQAKRILLIGLGRWGANHLRVLHSMPVELYVAETDPARLSSSGVPQTHRAANAASLVPIIDAAVVVTPAQTHFELCRDLLSAGKDVFVEKPITAKSDDAKQQIKMLRANFSGFKRPRQDTGVTFADGIHFIDLFQFLLGASPRRVHAIMRNFLGRTGQMDDESLRAELAAFLEAIETRNRPLVNGADGMNAVRVVEAALESARTGKWIDI